MDRNQADLALHRDHRDLAAGGACRRWRAASSPRWCCRIPARPSGLSIRFSAHLRNRRRPDRRRPAALPPLVDAFRRCGPAAFALSCGPPASTKRRPPRSSHVLQRWPKLLASFCQTKQPADLVRLLLTRVRIPISAQPTGGFRAYRKKGKWGEAAKRAGLSKADGDRLNAAAERHYAACCEAWNAITAGRRQPRSGRSRRSCAACDASASATTSARRPCSTSTI